MDHYGIENQGSKNTHINLNGMTRPTIELDDFFAYLDPKVVEKIKQTSEADRERISKNIQDYEYEMEGTKSILDSLK
jgi:hypothetical protein